MEVKPKFAERKQNEYLDCSLWPRDFDGWTVGKLAFFTSGDQPKRRGTPVKRRPGFVFWCSYKTMSLCWMNKSCGCIVAGGNRQPSKS